MKNLLLIIPVAFSICAVLPSCGGNSAGAPDAASTPGASSSSGDSTFEGKGSLAYTVDGNHYDIKDVLKTGGKNWIALVVNEIKDDPATGMVKVNLTNYLTKEVFDLVAADKGSTSVLHYTPSLSPSKAEASYMSPQYKTYYGDSVSITINTVDASHVSGTFAGEFLAQSGKKVRITGGSFDVPIPRAGQ